MKTPINISAAILIILALSISSCRRDKNDLTEDDAADAIEFALSSSTAGFAAQVEDAVSITQDATNKNEEVYSVLAIPCGVEYDSTVTRSGNSGLYSWDYQFNWSYVLNCSGIVPESITFTYMGAGVYNTPRMSSDDNAEATLTITSLDNGGTVYEIEGQYNRNGTQISKVRNQNTFTSVITITLTDVVVNRASQEIELGSGSVLINGSVSNGNDYNFLGQITFNGGGSATLVVNGTTYTIQI